MFGQNENDYEIFINIEVPATFEGGMDNFYKIVSKNLRSVDDKIGRVFVQFLIDTIGKTSNFKILKGLSEKSDNEVLRLMKWINQNYSWKPRLEKGKKVASKMNIPIVFREENIEKKIFDFENLDTTQIFMTHHFLPPIKIDYIEIERDTNNQEYLIYTIVENPPVFEGGQDNFYKIVSKNLKLAEEPNGIGSIAFIEFVIDTTGKMTDFKILKSGFSEKNNQGFLQLLDFINSTYTWKPAFHKGKKVFVRMSLPIRICRLD